MGAGEDIAYNHYSVLPDFIIRLMSLIQDFSCHTLQPARVSACRQIYVDIQTYVTPAVTRKHRTPMPMCKTL